MLPPTPPTLSMTTVCIGTSEASLGEVNASWLREQIGRRRDASHPVCVRIKITEPDVDLILPCGACGGTQGSSRRLTKPERELVDQWQAKGLNSPDFDFGRLVSFLNSLS